MLATKTIMDGHKKWRQGRVLNTREINENGVMFLFPAKLNTFGEVPHLMLHSRNGSCVGPFLRNEIPRTRIE